MPLQLFSSSPVKLWRRLGAVGLLGLTLVVAACGTTSTSAAGCPSTKTLTGAGSTFDGPLFSKLFTVYAGTSDSSVKCSAQVNYQLIGSGAGINDLLQQVVDFGATDAPMTDAQLSQSQNGPIIHIPITLGAVAMSYNVKGVPNQIKLTGPVIADIYLGKVTFWDDPEITALNPGVSFPHEAITVVHRSDGSGTTSIFTHYLAAISPDWSSKVGASTTVNWPVGVGGKGNPGVAAAVKQTEGALGYVELAYVVANNFPYALVQNAAGSYVAPSLDGAKADASNVTTIPNDLRFYIVNAPGADSYPISGFSWVIVYQKQSNADKGKALADLLWWMVHSGQNYSSALTYVPLPSGIVAKDEAQIKSMTCGGSPCYSGS
jgi:phosphate transport system substrate-binding protein